MSRPVRARLSWQTLFLPSILLIFLAGAAPLRAAGPLVFAPLPTESPETVVGQWRPMLDRLGKALGTEIRIEYSVDYDEVLAKLRAGTVDLAQLGPLPYVTLKKRFPAATPIVRFKERDGKAAYTCALVALEERKFAPRALRGRTVALTQPLSTCGYLVTDALLRQGGSTLEQNRYRYLKQHDAVAIAVARGDYDLGGMKTSIARKYAHLGVTVLAESRPLPAFSLVANGERVGPERIEQIRRFLVESDELVRADWGDNIRHGAVSAADGDFDALRALLASSPPIPEKGNF